MKTYKLLPILLAFTFVLSSVNASNPEWGATGHRTIGKIAEGYLTSKAKRKVEELLNGKSLALVSTFGDDIKSDKRYKEFYTWHYINMPFDVKYEDSEKNKDGDLVSGINKCKEVLLDKNASKEDKAFYLKMLVHLMGDLHQPMHVGRSEDKGGNDIQVRWFNDGTNLHSVWDSKMIEHYNMTFTELADNTDKISKEQIKYLQKGSIADWANETQQLAIKVYGSAEVGEKLGYNYVYNNFELVRSQLQVGGIRLAEVLNTIFS
ncbi:S1/P1 nuclease [Lutibacter maritimus]|uniref:S1/P1 Nuclease n=1 Tax=Lutibacter maritimus TaxID=593133 RepID=A0A1I6SU41_9FLAO|nr:S1/P1 nuclease [Lutibacter maritimus]SFS80431.1 S1/P1 Nuclease [Lutibacter maritimus]